MIRTLKGAIIEYAISKPQLVLSFEFNPESMTRTRSVTVNTGNSSAARGGYDFETPLETPRASQGVSVNAESLSVKILLDATDRMDKADPIATQFGIQPEIDAIRTMLEPKTQSPSGVQTLSSLGHGSARAFARHESASVLLFVWGIQVLPVFMTQAQIEIKNYLPNLRPYRAEATLSLQIIESNNPFYMVEIRRQVAGAALKADSTAIPAIAGLT